MAQMTKAAGSVSVSLAFIAVGMIMSTTAESAEVADCFEIANRDHARYFIDAKEEILKLNDEQLQGWMNSTIDIARTHRDAALRCFDGCQDSKDNVYWNISFSYRALSATLEALRDHDKELYRERPAKLRQEIILRIDYALEHLSRLE